jgi:hypothetical protein
MFPNEKYLHRLFDAACYFMLSSGGDGDCHIVCGEDFSKYADAFDQWRRDNFLYSFMAKWTRYDRDGHVAFHHGEYGQEAVVFMRDMVGDITMNYHTIVLGD